MVSEAQSSKSCQPKPCVEFRGICLAAQIGGLLLWVLIFSVAQHSAVRQNSALGRSTKHGQWIRAPSLGVMAQPLTLGSVTSCTASIRILRPSALTAPWSIVQWPGPSAPHLWFLTASWLFQFSFLWPLHLVALWMPLFTWMLLLLPSMPR